MSGYALRIELSQHLYRVYSSAPTYTDPAAAKTVAAKVALDQDVIIFIKHGDGQKVPLPSSEEYITPSAVADVPDIQEMRRRAKADRDLLSKAVSLQTFFDNLPKPLPDAVALKPADGTSHPISWLSKLVQQGKSYKLNMVFIWTSDPRINCASSFRSGLSFDRLLNLNIQYTVVSCVWNMAPMIHARTLSPLSSPNGKMHGLLSVSRLVHKG